MTDKKQEIRKIVVKELCELIKNGDVGVGDRFLVARDIKNSHYFSHEEIIYDVVDGHCADTIVKEESYEKLQGLVPEFRYMAEGGYAITLDASLLGSKDYHKLLSFDGK